MNLVVSPLTPYFPIPDLPSYIHSQSRKGQKSVTWFPIVVINLYRDPSLLIHYKFTFAHRHWSQKKKSRPILKEIIWWAIKNLIKIEGKRESEHYRLNPIIKFIWLFPPLMKGFWIRLHQTLLKTGEVFKICEENLFIILIIIFILKDKLKQRIISITSELGKIEAPKCWKSPTWIFTKRLV